MNGDAIPVIEVGFLCLDQFQFLFGIIDERTKLLLLGLTDGVAKEFIDLTLDVS